MEAFRDGLGDVDFLDVYGADIDVVVEKGVEVGVFGRFLGMEESERSCLAGGVPGRGAYEVELPGVFEISERLGRWCGLMQNVTVDLPLLLVVGEGCYVRVDCLPVIG